jgi:sporulation protein YlmC with PRC-barrel domain
MKSLTVASAILGICSWVAAQEAGRTDPRRQDPMNPDRTKQMGQDANRAGDSAKSQMSVILKGSDLIGKNVVNPEGKNLGEIKNLAIDAEQGRIAYAILSFGGFLGIGDKLFAIPWGALRVGPGGENFVLNVTKEKLEKAPGFDSDKWPDLTNRQQGTDLHTYYGVSPYWENAAWKGVIQPGRDVADAGYGRDAAYAKHFNPQSVQTITGRIDSIDEKDAKDAGMGEAVCLMVKTTSDTTMKVHLGPNSYVRSQNLELRKGDQVEVTGSKVTIDGKECLIATELRKDGKSLRLRDPRGTPAWTSGRDASDPTGRGRETDPTKR